eukprot:5259988-Pyramimonas_sp.AAC.1
MRIFRRGRPPRAHAQVGRRRGSLQSAATAESEDAWGLRAAMKPCNRRLNRYQPPHWRHPPDVCRVSVWTRPRRRNDVECVAAAVAAPEPPRLIPYLGAV